MNKIKALLFYLSFTFFMNILLLITKCSQVKYFYVPHDEKLKESIEIIEDRMQYDILDIDTLGPNGYRIKYCRKRK